ncbi:MAG: rhomboid family intramembrane serine protease [Bryobacterales bacterium]|nr:rhomboid family intramembrane serine protease [Bryobacterales bacterium]
MIPLRDTEPSYSKPYMVMALIAVNAAVFFYQLSLPPQALERFVSTWALVPDRLVLHSLLTSMFLHGGWLHIIGNMWFLWIFGDNIEDVLGHGQFLVFYLVCGFLSAIAHVVMNLGSPVPTLGASGAIAGVMGAYMAKFPRSRILTLIPIFIFFTTIEIPAPFLLLYWLLIQIVSGTFAAGQSALASGTAWFAHIGGFVAGFLLIRLFKTQPRRRRLEADWT